MSAFLFEGGGHGWHYQMFLQRNSKTCYTVIYMTIGA